MGRSEMRAAYANARDADEVPGKAELFVAVGHRNQVALLVFELATHAVNHGALSENVIPSASVHVHWRVEEGNSPPSPILNWRGHRNVAGSLALAIFAGGPLTCSPICGDKYDKCLRRGR
jgi:hypothetical protein